MPKKPSISILRAGEENDRSYLTQRIPSLFGQTGSASFLPALPFFPGNGQENRAWVEAYCAAGFHVSIRKTTFSKDIDG